MIDIEKEFEKYDSVFCKFDQIQDKLSQRRDLCAFMYLDKLIPDQNGKIISCAEHDEIYLEVDISELAKVATEEDVLFLLRCGVRYDSELESLCMFV